MRNLEEIKRDFTNAKCEAISKLNGVLAEYLPCWEVKNLSSSTLFIVKQVDIDGIPECVRHRITFSNNLFDRRKFDCEVDIPTWGNMECDEVCVQREFYIALGILLGTDCFKDIKTILHSFHTIERKLEKEADDID